MTTYIFGILSVPERKHVIREKHVSNQSACKGCDRWGCAACVITEEGAPSEFRFIAGTVAAGQTVKISVVSADVEENSKEHDETICPSCGYDLDASLQESECPHCGYSLIDREDEL